MLANKIGEFTGYSTRSIHEAIENALEKVGEYAHFEVIETLCSQAGEKLREYQVTLAAFL